jgi:hypothetical protein
VVRGQTAAALGTVLLVLSCGAPEVCDDEGVGCPPGIYFRGHTYLEGADPAFRPGRDRAEELGDGTYTGCRGGETCTPRTGGFGTDVWRLVGTDPDISVVGLRRDTHRYVVFTRTTAG